jgi:hypothetical protein
MRSREIRALPLLLALAAVGCGRPVGNVSGKILYKGSPVAMGSVVLVDTDGIPHSGRIEDDGTFVIAEVPAGTVKVAVQSPDPGRPLRETDLPPSQTPLMQKMKGMKIDLGGAKGDRKKWRRLPKQYEDPNTSGLTLSVRKGENSQDIELQ